MGGEEEEGKRGLRIREEGGRMRGRRRGLEMTENENEMSMR